jgi:hypothetical protein
LDYRDLAL